MKYKKKWTPKIITVLYPKKLVLQCNTSLIVVDGKANSVDRDLIA